MFTQKDIKKQLGVTSPSICTMLVHQIINIQLGCRQTIPFALKTKLMVKAYPRQVSSLQRQRFIFNSAKQLIYRINYDRYDVTYFSCLADTNWFSAPMDNWGWCSFIDLATLKDPNNGFIVKDDCLLYVEISVQAVSTKQTS